MARADAQLMRFVEAPGDTGASAFSPEERAILDEINRRVAAAESIEKLIDFLFEQTRAISPCDRVSLALLSDEGRRVVSHYSRTLYEPVLLDKGYAEDLQGSTLYGVFRRGLPRIIDDLEAYAAAHPQSASTRLLVEEGVRSSMTCPLVVEGRPVGILFRSARRPRAYDDHQALLHLAVAERLAQSVEKAWRIEQLTEANRAYSEMLGFVAHELKSPLAAIVMQGSLLLDNFIGKLTPEQHATVEKMLGKARYLSSIIGEYLNLSRIESGELVLHVQPGVGFAPAIVAPCLELVQPLIEQRGMVIDQEIAEGLAVSCDPELLRIAMANLINNAVKYGNEGGRIVIRARLEGRSLEVVVWNEGPGFAAQDQKLLFRKFSRLARPESAQEKGTGLGLYTTWRIVNLHGGKIQARSEPGQWAEFSFRIPV